MSKRLRQGLQLSLQSWSALQANKSLLIFPISSILLCMGLLFAIVRPLWQMELHSPHGLGWVMVILAAYFFVCHFIIIFANSALIASAQLYFENKPVNVKTGLFAACRNILNLLVWTIFATTAGIVVRIIESWSDHWESIGLVLAYLGGLGWLFASYFVIPVLIFESRDPFTALKRSSYLMRNTWGHTIGANFGLGIIIFFLRVISLIPALIAAHAGGIDNLIIGGAVTVILWLTVSLFQSSTMMLLRGALYEYAINGKVAHFDENILQQAFKIKKAIPKN